MEILFYKLRDPFGEFSNFYRRWMIINGVKYPTVEHYFQAMKFGDATLRDLVINAKTPRIARDLGQTRHPSYRTDWEQIKDEVMWDGVMAKFSQHDDLRAVLMSTGDGRIVEHTWKDAYWGDGGDGSGRNQLGITLMGVRESFGGTGIV